MPQIADIALLHLAEQPTLVIRARTPLEGLPPLIGQSYGKIAQYLQEQGEAPADMPFVGYHNLDMADLDVEIGFPLALPLPGRGEIQAGLHPAGYGVIGLYQGPYAQMEPLYRDMAAWIEANGLIPAGPAYEYYFNGPGAPESALLTKVVMPVIKK